MYVLLPACVLLRSPTFTVSSSTPHLHCCTKYKHMLQRGVMPRSMLLQAVCTKQDPVKHCKWVSCCLLRQNRGECLPANDALGWRECCLVTAKCPGTQDAGVFPSLPGAADDCFPDHSFSGSKRGVVFLCSSERHRLLHGSWVLPEVQM